jgi:hypothetical protein
MTKTTRSCVTFGTAALIGICFGSLFAGAVLFVANAKPGLIATQNGPLATPAAYNATVTR